MNPAGNSHRLVSLDAFRGFTIAAMLLVNNPGDWSRLYAPLAHAKWNGWTFTDTVFPFFLFIGGVAMTLSLGQRARHGADKGALLRKLAGRAAIIFLIGFCLNLIPKFDFSSVRLFGVLQRIALCTVLAAPLVIYCSWRKQLLAILALLALYSALMLGVTVPDAYGVLHTGSLAAGEDTGAWLDRLLFSGHLWVQSKTWDPEGLLSTLPAVCSLLFGVLAGHVLAARMQAVSRVLLLAAAGAACLVTGLVLDAVFMPINKSLWTVSYCIFMTGWALLAFAAFYYVLDVLASRSARWLATPLLMYGMNALFLFALSGLIAKMLGFIKPGGQSLKAVLYAPLQSLPLAPQMQSLLFAVWFNALMLGIAWLLWRKRWFIKV
ncbi:MAG TPA: heparan-alpha-glucosaminide N-acetyltransferase domain-containing protein [Burkholderiaceae bacterium]